MSTNSVISTIDVGDGPEDIKLINGKIWVANSGGYGVDSTISVIDPTTDVVEKTIVVGDCPKEIVQDANLNLWVLCYGSIVYDANWNIASQTPSKLVKVSASTFQKVSEIIISDTQHPQHLDISNDKKTLYYGGGYAFAGIYSVSTSATSVSSSPLIDGTKYFYGFNVNPATGELYALEAPTFTSAGKMYKYNSSGSLSKQYNVGVGPNGIIFL
jgi:YVTN family beta-propeller protein